MKTYSVLILICILKASVYSQVQSSCQKSAELEYYYKMDVADLAMRRMFETNSPDTSQIEIPQIHLDSIWNGLSAIYNMSEFPERDSVFDIFCIHNLSSFSSILWPAIYIEVDTSVNWTGNWINGEIVTGNTGLDNFISSYNYYILSSNPGYPHLVICSDSLINSYAVSDSLMSFSGIESAGPIPMTLDNNKIHYSIEGDYQYFTFTLAWGDCLAGCIYWQRWKFKVHYLDCTVELLELESNTSNNLPNPVNCNITAIDDKTADSNEIVIYPNPAGERVTICIPNDLEDGVITLFDINGRRIIHEKFPDSYRKGNNCIALDISNVPAGVYFMEIQSPGNRLIRKLLVQ